MREYELLNVLDRHLYAIEAPTGTDRYVCTTS